MYFIENNAKIIARLEKEFKLVLSKSKQPKNMKTITFTLILSLLTSLSFASIPESEKQALLDLYAYTNGDAWTQTWDLTAEPTAWKGVTIISNHVMSITLKNNNLNGTLPTSLKDLKFLRVLNLHNNNLVGEIPSSVAELKALKILNLSINKIKGSIPNEISQMTNLEYFDVFFNELSGELPNDLSSLTNLKRLSVYGNFLEGEIPDSISSLKNLKELQLSSNSFTGEIPRCIVSLPNLKSLSLFDNNFEGIFPKEINDLNLDELAYHRNNFIETPLNTALVGS